MKSRTPAEIGEAWTISPASFRRLAELIERELGIQMPASKTVLIQSRLGGRVQELGLRSIDEYCDLIFSAAGAGAERAHLVNAVTTNKTDFFREAQQLEYLTQTILPELERLRRTTSARRTLSAARRGCACT